MIMQVKKAMEKQQKFSEDGIVLVVDDNETSRELLTHWLNSKNIKTISVDSGKKALDTICQTKVDLVFMDLLMPGMSGFEVLEEIRQTQSSWQLPVIIATGQVDKTTVIEAFDKGASDFITKPLIFQAAIARAKNLLTHKKLQDEVIEVNSRQEVTIDEKTLQLKETIHQLQAEIEKSRIIELELREARDKAEVANRAKSEFLANMSHELRTPLNAIIGFSDILKSGMLGDKPITCSREYSADIHGSAVHLLNIINDILDLSKIEADKICLDEGHVCLKDMTDPTFSILRQNIMDKELEIIADEEFFARIQLNVDERRFKQILLNLLSNSVKFTPRGGTISIKVISCTKEGFSLEVRDDGIGMNPDDISKAMEPFSQVDSGLDRQYEGTGLGLPLVKALTEMHGGTFELESQLHVGTIATIRFPASRIIVETRE